jgi:hypothetical protein
MLQNINIVDYFSKLLVDSHDMLEQVALQDILRRVSKQQSRRRAEVQRELDKVQPANLLSRFEKAFYNLRQLCLSTRFLLIADNIITESGSASTKRWE